MKRAVIFLAVLLAGCVQQAPAGCSDHYECAETDVCVSGECVYAGQRTADAELISCSDNAALVRIKNAGPLPYVPRIRAYHHLSGSLSDYEGSAMNVWSLTESKYNYIPPGEYSDYTIPFNCSGVLEVKLGQRNILLSEEDITALVEEINRVYR